MSKPLGSFPEEQRTAKARERAGAVENGLGKLSAQDYLKKKKITLKEIEKKPKDDNIIE